MIAVAAPLKIVFFIFSNSFLIFWNENTADALHIKNRAMPRKALLCQRSERIEQKKPFGRQAFCTPHGSKTRSRIALRIAATTERILSELPEAVQVSTVLRHPNLSPPQRLTLGFSTTDTLFKVHLYHFCQYNIN